MNELLPTIETGSVMNSAVREQLLKQQDLVSIIVPVYNVEDYLQACMDSILAQTYKNVEIIVVDDGSTDSSGQLCDTIGQTDSRIQVIHQENGGLSAARNTGIDHASGEYFLFVDSDDSILPTMVEDLYVYSKLYDGDITCCGFEWLGKDDQFQQNTTFEVNVMDAKEALRRLRIVYLVVQWNKLFKRKIFDDLRFAEGILHEDEQIAHYELVRANRIVCLNKKLYIYNAARANSITNTGGSVKRYYHVTQSWLERLALYREVGLEKEAYKSIMDYFSNRLLRYFVMCSHASDKDIYVPKFQQVVKDLSQQYPEEYQAYVGNKRRLLLWMYTHMYPTHVILDGMIYLAAKDRW